MIKVKKNHINFLESVQTQIPNNLLEELKERCFYLLNNSIEQTDVRKNLVGFIEKEYDFNDKIMEKINPYILECAKTYDTDNQYSIDSTWINFQKKTEYNPLHTHFADLSFVIWVNIPYSFEDEYNLEASKYSKIKVNGIFEFVYQNIYGDLHQSPYYTDKNSEGSIILFSSGLNHCVHPFYTSDDYRISIAGNLSKKKI